MDVKELSFGISICFARKNKWNRFSFIGLYYDECCVALSLASFGF